MRMLSCSPEDRQSAVKCLQEGGIVIHPTETCYGVACDIANLDAVSRVFALKRRQENQPISALFSDIAHAEKYVHWTAQAMDLAQRYLPGPLTIILRMRGDAPAPLFVTPKEMTHGERTIGVRISSHPVASALVDLMHAPLTTTSANLHGMPSAYAIPDLLAQWSDISMRPDIILDGGILPPFPASTIVDCSGSVMRVIRQGTLTLEEKM